MRHLPLLRQGETGLQICYRAIKTRNRGSAVEAIAIRGSEVSSGWVPVCCGNESGRVFTGNLVQAGIPAFDSFRGCFMAAIITMNSRGAR